MNNNTKSTRGEITIVSINTWLAQASADYNTTRQTVGLKVWDSHSGDTSSTTSYTVDVDDVPAIEGLKKDDFVLVNMTGKYETGKMAVVAVSQPEIISAATVTEYSKGDSSTIDSDTVKALFKNVTANGTKYDSSAMAHYDAGALNAYYNELLTDKTYNVYLDKYGYALGVDLCEGEANYVFITGYDLNGSSIAGGSVKANAIFLDGTVKTINVNLKDTNDNIGAIGSTDKGKDYFEKWQADTAMIGKQTYAINRWFTYVEKNGEYVLNPATRMFTTEVTAARTIKCNSVRIDADPSIVATTGGKNAKVPADGVDTRKAYGNDDSVFIVAELGNVADATTGKVITGVDGLYTGVQNVEIDVYYKAAAAAAGAETFVLEGFGTGTATAIVDNIYTVFDSNNYIIGAVILGEAKGSNSNLAYIKSAATLERRVDDTYYWEFEAVVDGTIQTLTVKDKFGTGIKKLAPGHVQELRYDGQYVVSIKDPGASKFYTIADYTTKAITNESIYDVGHKQNTAECGKSSCSADIGYETSADKRLDGTTTNGGTGLNLDGRTLYLENDQSDYGLTLVQDAKAVVHQQVNGKWGWFEYDSVKEAIDNMGDAKASTTNIQEYAGRITAVLDSNGVAKWVVFNSDTDYVTGNVVTTSGKVEGVTDGGIFTDKADIAKYLVPGAYSLRDNASGALKASLGMTSEVKDCLFFVFNAGTSAQNVSLRIVAPDGKAYTEASSSTVNGAHAFYVDVLGSPVKHNSAAGGDLAGGVGGVNGITWPAGEYTWQVVGATTGDLGHGTFTIVR